MIRETLLRRIDLLVAIVLFILLNLLFSTFQKPITYNDGLGWDGVYYAKITQDFRNGLPPQTVQPFVNRIGVPLLGSLLNFDIIASWRFLNIIANFFLIILLHFFLSLFFRQQWLRFILILFFLLPFHSYVRVNFFNPVSTDSWCMIFLILGIIVIHRLRTHGWRATSVFLLSLITFIGVFFREVVVVLPFVALFVHNPVKINSEKHRRLCIILPPASAVLPILSAILALILVKILVVPSTNTTLLGTAVSCLYGKSFPDYILSWFIAFGPILIFPIIELRKSIKFLLDNQYLMVYLISFSILGWIGGSATYRILKWGLPVVFILVGLTLQRNMSVLRRNYPFAFVFFLSYLVSQRVFWVLPDYPGGEFSLLVFLTPLTGNPPLLDIIGMGSGIVNMLSLATYLLWSTFLVLMLHPPRIISSRKELY